MNKSLKIQTNDVNIDNYNSNLTTKNAYLSQNNFFNSNTKSTKSRYKK